MNRSQGLLLMLPSSVGNQSLIASEQQGHSPDFFLVGHGGVGGRSEKIKLLQVDLRSMGGGPSNFENPHCRYTTTKPFNELVTVAATNGYGTLYRDKNGQLF